MGGREGGREGGKPGCLFPEVATTPSATYAGPGIGCHK